MVNMKILEHDSVNEKAFHQTITEAVKGLQKRKYETEHKTRHLT